MRIMFTDILSKMVTENFYAAGHLFCERYQQPKWSWTVRARPVMKNNKITAEEQDTVGKLGKLCSERKTCRQKWLATLCLSSGRHECISWYTHYHNVRAQLG